MGRNSLLGDSFDRIEIEAFSKGSVLVDYYVFFKNFEEQVTTSDLKIVLNQQLEDPLGQTMLGRFMVDPSYTDFIVVANPDPAPAAAPEDVGGMPDWAIAVVVIGLGSFAFVLVFGITVMSNKRRRSAKKKHEVPLTEDMLNELNKASLGHQGYMMHHSGSGNGKDGMAQQGYDNYGQDPDEFYDMEDVWNNDKYYGQGRSKRQSNRSSERETVQTQSTSANSKSNPYQSQNYDSWRTEWNVPYYDQYRSGPSVASSSAEAVNHSGGGRSAYMTKGGRRLSYEDDF